MPKVPVFQLFAPVSTFRLALPSTNDMDTDSGHAPVPSWLLAAPFVLSFVSLMFSSPVIRKAMFVPLAGVVVHIMRIGGGMSGRDYPMACALTSQVVQMFDFLVLTDAHTALRLRDHAAGAPANLFGRAKWVLRLLTSPRLAGWANEPKNGVIPPRPTDTSRLRFACKQILYLGCNLLTMNVLNITMGLTPGFSAGGPGLAGRGWGWRSVNALQHGAAAWMGISIAHRAWVLALLCTGRWMPSDLPPMFAPLGNAYTLRRFWGRTYHQMLRRTLTSHGAFVTDKLLRLPGDAKLTRRYTQLYVAFLVSGALHYWAEYMTLHNFSGGSLRFFLSQAVAIHCEDIVIAAAGRLGWKQSGTWEVIGYVWVWQWFAWCIPGWVDPLVRIGLIEQGAKVEIIQGVCGLFGKACYLPA
ncbi:wax synthase family protein [Pleurotus pulmonarius]